MSAAVAVIVCFSIFGEGIAMLSKTMAESLNRNSRDSLKIITNHVKHLLKNQEEEVVLETLKTFLVEEHKVFH